MNISSHRLSQAIGLPAALSIFDAWGAASAIDELGFKLAGDNDLLRRPEDPGAAVFRLQMPADAFALKYRKPL